MLVNDNLSWVIFKESIWMSVHFTCLSGIYVATGQFVCWVNPTFLALYSAPTGFNSKEFNGMCSIPRTGKKGMSCPNEAFFKTLTIGSCLVSSLQLIWCNWGYSHCSHKQSNICSAPACTKSCCSECHSPWCRNPSLTILHLQPPLLHGMPRCRGE